ncbi:LamG domain-containing protein [Micromonospora zhanjiangensis]|uniref:LamG domain-containing protein n=1 Tax=Micromonospora zhanjiangensis TaxID=1522057 RepID=A0ABV8KLM2_9ACTN
MLLITTGAAWVEPAVPARAAPAAPARPATAPDERSAVAAAKRSGEQVEVLSARTELTQVFAKPTGGLVAESAVEPQRVRQADGSWADIDLSLRRGGDGLLRPVASTADVRFSTGGSEALVTLTRGSSSFSLTWPTPLPAPSVSGDSATYPEVKPGVDLVVRATVRGFSHVLVIKTAAAAGDPSLREIKLRLGGDADVQRLPDGSLRAVVQGREIATAEPALMWDSASAAPAEMRSSVTGSGDGARTAPVTTEVSDSELLLKPDQAMLTDGRARFPIFIDPAWSTGKSRWAYSNNANKTNDDLSNARVGRNPVDGVLYRSYFDFPLSALKGKYIYKAYVQMVLDHSHSCEDTITHLFHTNGITSTPRSKWAPALNKWIGQAYSHGNEDDGCGAKDPDMTVNFTNDGVRELIQTHAKNQWTNVTLGFCACGDIHGVNESDQKRWKRYFPNKAKLIVDFDSYPGAPINPQVGGVACTPGLRLTVGTKTPTLSAIFPDADTTQALRTEYELLQVPASGTYNDSTPRMTPPAGTSVPAGGRSTTAALPALAEAFPPVVYAFRARSTDPAPYNQGSLPSQWCEFTVDTHVPNVTAALSGPTPVPGQVAPVTITTTDTTVTKFRYGWSSPPTTEVDPEPPTSAWKRSASVSPTVPKYGRNVLYVAAVDGAGNVGYGSIEFVANRPSPAVARWGLDSYPGVTQAQALADSQPALGGDTPLTAGNVSWANDIHIVGGSTVSLNGTSSYLQAPTPVVDTTKSYGVSAWVRLSALPTQNMAIATQSGTCIYGFYFGATVSAGAARWNVTTRQTDCGGSASYTSLAAPNPITSADVGRWQHVAVSYDEAARTLTLFVDGRPVASTPWATAWSATNPFQVGRLLVGTTANNYFAGALSDVQVFDRALVDQDFTGQLASDPSSGGVDEPGFLTPVKVGNWNFQGALSCYQPTTDPELCSVLNAGKFPQRLAMTPGSVIGHGYQGNGLLLDRQGVDDPSQATTEYAKSQKNVGTDSMPLWQDARVVRTDQSFSVSAWVNPSELNMMTAVSQMGAKQSAFYLCERRFDVNGTMEHRWTFDVFGSDNDDLQGKTVRATMQSRVMTEDDLATWTHLVGVFDRSRREVRLYINGALEQTTTFGSGAFTNGFDSTGPLTVGAGRFTFPGQSTNLVDLWQGGIDEVNLFQGALSDADVKLLFDSQSLDTAE